MEIMNRYYFNVEDLFRILNLEIDTGYLIGSIVTNGLPSVINAAFNIGSTVSSEAYSKSESNELWCRYLIQPYYDHYLFYIDSDVEPNSTEQSKAVVNWCRLFLAKLNETYPKYSKLISVYNSEANKLMDDIKAYSRYNDTPQNGGDFSSDSYSTTYTESGSQLASKMARLEEIRTYWNNIYAQWANEFGGLFIND